MKKIIAAALAAAAAHGAAGAQQQTNISNPRGIAANFDAANLGPILTELGIAWQARTAPNGQAYIEAALGDLYVNLIPAACEGANNTGCVGLSTLALFPGQGVNAQTVMAFGQRYFFTSVGVTPDGAQSYINRYDIADYGIPRGNIESSLVNFAYLAQLFRQEMSSGANTISQEGFADDMSARFLNKAGVVAIGGAMPAGPRHQAAIEENAEIIKMLAADPAAARNKIENPAAKD